MIDDLRARLDAVGSGERRVPLDELEELYTSGCGQVLELEAEAMRRGPRRALASQEANELRAELRHVRTVIEWLRDDAGAAGTG